MESFDLIRRAPCTGLRFNAMRGNTRNTVFILASMIACSAAHAQVQYVITDLGSLGGAQPVSEAWDINDAGQVVGSSSTSAGTRGFIWDATNGMVSLGDLNGGMNYSIAKAINASGDVVGASSATSGTRGFIWNVLTGMTDIGELPGGLDFSYANGINDSGVVTGYSNNELGTAAFRWDATNGMIGLPDFSGGLVDGVGNDINNVGQVIGDAFGPLSMRAVRWDGETILDLGDLGGNSKSAFTTSINNAGQVTGSSTTPDDGTPPFLWDPATGMRNLGHLPLGPNVGSAMHVNESGLVVGYSFTNEGERAFRWDPANGIMSLNDIISPTTPGWTLITANSVNNNGVIVGRGIFNGQSRAFMATPVAAEPVTIKGYVTLPPLSPQATYPISTYMEVRDQETLQVFSTVPVLVNQDGTYECKVNRVGPTVIAMRGMHFLRDSRPKLYLGLGATVLNQNFTLFNGDCNGDNVVNTDDYLMLNDNFDTEVTQGFLGDLDEDRYVGTDDYLILNDAFDSIGEP